MFNTSQERYARIFALFVALALGCAVSIAQAQSSERQAERPVVYLVPFGDISQEVVDQVALHIENSHGLRVIIQHRKSLTKQMIDYLRRQAPAQEFVNFMEPRFVRTERKTGDAIYLGLTNYDMYVAGLDWEFAFAARKAPGVAIVSNYRMDPTSYHETEDVPLTIARTKKMVSKMIGHLYRELPESDDPNSLMYKRIRTLADLDRVSDKF